MIQSDLSEKEKLVLYNLIKFPSLNDRELSERIDMKISTLTSIKNRLRKGNYFRTIRIPSIELIGYEILWIRTGTYNPVKDTAEITKYEKKMNKLLGMDTFYFIVDGHNFFSMNISKNYTEAKVQINKLEKDFQTKGYLKGSNYIFMPTSLTFNFIDFDHSLLIKNSFGIENEDEDLILDMRSTATKHQDLKKSEIKILKNLIAEPDMPDTTIAAKINTTRQAVSRLRKRFEKEGNIKTVRIPNLKKLGFGIMVISYVKHNPKVLDNDSGKMADGMLKSLPMIYLVSSKLESVGIHVYKDFYEYQVKNDMIVAEILKNEYVTTLPEKTLISIPNTDTIMDLDFSKVSID